MEGGRAFGGCHDMISLLENSNNSLWHPSSSFHEKIMNFGQEPQQGLMGANPKSDRCNGLLARPSNVEDAGGNNSDVNLYNNSEKKRRLTAEQAQILEKSFELENKLEPERKVQLAKQVGLQPRQVAIWFQNRRARYKTKQIEKEFDSLKASYDTLKVDYDILYKEKEYYKNEVEVWKKKFAQKEGREINSNPGNIQQMVDGTTNIVTHGRVDKTGSAGVVLHSMKQVEDANSAKSDIFDYESPHCVDGNQSSALLETCSTPLMRDPDHQSDFSQEEHIMMTRSLLLPQTPPTFNNFLNVADDENYDHNANSCNFSVADDQPNLSWLY